MSYVTLTIICLFALLVRTGYEQLKLRGIVKPENRIAVAIIFAFMMALWASWFGLCPEDPLPLDLPDPLRWLGLGLVILGLILALTALGQLRGVENIDHLVTTGLFARLRHPMYAGFILWVVGWILYHGAGASIAPGSLIIANVFYWAGLEDAHLRVKFGAAYEEYRKQTWF